MGLRSHILKIVPVFVSFFLLKQNSKIKKGSSFKEKRFFHCKMIKADKKEFIYSNQGRNHRENLGATTLMVGRICPPSWNKVKVSENLGATAVAPVAPVVR